MTNASLRQRTVGIHARPALAVKRIGCFCIAVLCCPAFAQPDPSGIDFVTIGAPNNPSYHGPDPKNRVTGRGSVPYEYKLSRSEVTTSQWMDFFNTFKARADPVPESMLPVPSIWGAELDPTYSGPGQRFRLKNEPNSGTRPVYNVDWRTSARYCNWLHNDKGVALSAIANGAYDTSTFGYPSPGVFTDQATRSPGARYWIPSLDEWLKGAHYDPTNQAREGWWLFPNRSDTPPVYGPPGQGESNAGFGLPGFAEYHIPLMSYPTVQSPWGLLDVSGCGTEWTEEIRIILGEMLRQVDGAAVSGTFDAASSHDSVTGLVSLEPTGDVFSTTFRVASLPSPGALSMLIVASAYVPFRTARRRPMPGTVKASATPR